MLRIGSPPCKFFLFFFTFMYRRHIKGWSTHKERLGRHTTKNNGFKINILVCMENPEDDPLKILRKKFNVKNIGTKSINMSDIIVYFAMFSTIIDKNLMFLGPHKMKMSHYFSVFVTLWNLGLFWFPKTPLILNFLFTL